MLSVWLEWPVASYLDPTDVYYTSFVYFGDIRTKVEFRG